MASKQDLLERMAANPAGGWTLNDVTTLANRLGMTVRPPRRGSHYRLKSPYSERIVTVPHDRPIKQHYIREVVALARRHLAQGQEDDR